MIPQTHRIAWRIAPYTGITLNPSSRSAFDEFGKT